MVVSDKDFTSTPRKPSGYKVAARNRVQLRSVATEFLPLLRSEGCYKDDGHVLDTSHLLERILFRAGFNLHVLEQGELSETAAFTIPERRLIVLRDDVYERSTSDDPFARSTVVHEFSHIVLDHAITLHRGPVTEHPWWEDTEWQANNLTAEILMPIAVVKELGCRPLLIQAACGVSSSAAHYRVENLKREGLI